MPKIAGLTKKQQQIIDLIVENDGAVSQHDLEQLGQRWPDDTEGAQAIMRAARFLALDFNGWIRPSMFGTALSDSELARFKSVQDNRKIRAPLTVWIATDKTIEIGG